MEQLLLKDSFSMKIIGKYFVELSCCILSYGETDILKNEYSLKIDREYIHTYNPSIYLCHVMLKTLLIYLNFHFYMADWFS